MADELKYLLVERSENCSWKYRRENGRERPLFLNEKSKCFSSDPMGAGVVPSLRQIHLFYGQLTFNSQSKITHGSWHYASVGFSPVKLFSSEDYNITILDQALHIVFEMMGKEEEGKLRNVLEGFLGIPYLLSTSREICFPSMAFLFSPSLSSFFLFDFFSIFLAQGSLGLSWEMCVGIEGPDCNSEPLSKQIWWPVREKKSLFQRHCCEYA